jgi:hypothetical protein
MELNQKEVNLEFAVVSLDDEKFAASTVTPKTPGEVSVASRYTSMLHSSQLNKVARNIERDLGEYVLAIPSVAVICHSSAYLDTMGKSSRYRSQGVAYGRLVRRAVDRRFGAHPIQGSYREDVHAVIHWAPN